VEVKILDKICTFKYFRILDCTVGKEKKLLAIDKKKIQMQRVGHV
jgi:hypothetical protein